MQGERSHGRVIRVACLFASVMLAAAGPVTAQVVDTQTVVVDGPVAAKVPVKTLDDLDRAFVSGEAATARQIARAMVDAAKAEATRKEAFDYDKNFLAIVWASVDVSGKGVLRRLILKDSDDRPYALDLPGIGVRASDPQLYELFISTDPRATLVTVYRSTREEDEALAQIPALAEKIIGPLFGLIADVRGERVGVAPPEEKVLPEPPPLFVTASAVKLPFRRATVQTRSTAHVPITVERFTEAVEKLSASVRFIDAPHSPAVREYATYLADALPPVAASCAGFGLSAVACLEVFEAVFEEAYRECEQACGPEGTKPGDADLTLIRSVDAKFRALVAIGPEPVQAEASFRNRPLRKFSFGAGTGVALWTRLNTPRVKLEGDQIVADPLGRDLTMILVNWSKSGYDPDTIEPTPAERYRWFLGAVLTPDFGVCAGGSLLLVRGLAVNTGLGLLFTRAVPGEDQLGKPPDNSSDPFELGLAGAWFIGATFNLK